MLPSFEKCITSAARPSSLSICPPGKNIMMIKNFAANLVKILWVWCWNQDAIIAVDGERVSSTKNSTDESVKDQGVVGCVFWLERHCPSWTCITWSDGKQTVVPGSFSVWGMLCLGRGLNCGKNQTWMLHHDNAPAHASLLILSYLVNIGHPLCPIHPILRI